MCTSNIVVIFASPEEGGELELEESLKAPNLVSINKECMRSPNPVSPTFVSFFVFLLQLPLCSYYVGIFARTELQWYSTSCGVVMHGSEMDCFGVGRSVAN
ncbi:unnamed protein product [Taenia asiatica]|uniref:Ovule protein n=1 Tax=Taenia asiatica TaxID=60517 RepID=A0A0R3WGY0_TAEAS|nr:unnamed protein product [Taenia asiatica]